MPKRYYAVRFSDGRREIAKTPQRIAELKENPSVYRKILQSKGFNSEIDASLWLDTPELLPLRKQFFAVKVGRRPGLYYTQEDYDKNVLGYSSAVGMAFYTEKAAKQWLGMKDETYSGLSTTREATTHANSGQCRMKQYDSMFNMATKAIEVDQKCYNGYYWRAIYYFSRYTQTNDRSYLETAIREAKIDPSIYDDAEGHWLLDELHKAYKINTC